jgi:hypothetical protein
MIGSGLIKIAKAKLILMLPELKMVSKLFPIIFSAIS